MRPPPRSGALGEVGGEAVLPRRQDDPRLALGPEDAVGRPARGPREALGRRRHDAAAHPARSKISTANSYHEHSPVPAGVEEADVALALGDLDERGREVAGPRRPAALVGDDGDLVALGAEAQHRRDEVRPPAPNSHAVRTIACSAFASATATSPASFVRP